MVGMFVDPLVAYELLASRRQVICEMEPITCETISSYANRIFNFPFPLLFRAIQKPEGPPSSLIRKTNTNRKPLIAFKTDNVYQEKK